MQPEEIQNNNEVELEAILLENQKQSETLDDIRATNEVQAIESKELVDQLEELNMTADMLVENTSKTSNIGITINGGDAIEAIKLKGETGEKGDKPVKGQDYLTPQEIEEIVKEVQSRVKDGVDGKDGKDAVVDYESIIREVVPLIPRGKDGKDGKDALIDYPSIIEEVLSKIPKPKDGKDGKSVKVEEVVSKLKKEDVFGEMEKRVNETHDRVNKISSKTYSLSELDDVDLSGATISNGKYVIGGGSGAVDSVNSQTGVVVLDADDIDDTSTTHKFTTASDISKLAGIEAGADVTDATNVNAAGAVMNSDYTPAHSVLVQQSGTGSPSILQVPNDTILGRLSGGGSDIDALTASEVRTLLNVEDGAEVNTVDSVAGKTGAVTLEKGDVGLGNVDNTSDANKPISTATQTALDAKATDDIAVMALLGSSYKAMTLGVAVGELTATIAFSDAQIRFTPVYLKTAQTITGVSWYQKVQGNYTADNNNKVGLYSYSGGTLTLVASCADDSALWSTAASESFGTKAFSSPYNASAGIYFVGLLYNQSSQTTAPSIGGAPNPTNLAVASYDFTNSAKLFSFVGTKTDLDSSIAMSALTAVASRPWVALY